MALWYIIFVIPQMLINVDIIITQYLCLKKNMNDAKNVAIADFYKAERRVIAIKNKNFQKSRQKRLPFS